MTSASASAWKTKSPSRAKCSSIFSRPRSRRSRIAVGRHLPPRARRQRRLLRFHSPRSHAHRHRARGHQRQGNLRRVADGQPPGRAAQHCDPRSQRRHRRPRRPVEPAPLPQHLRRPLRHALLRRVRHRIEALTYTNAGHLPPFFVFDGKIQLLDQGGTVVGLFEKSGLRARR